MDIQSPTAQIQQEFKLLLDPKASSKKKQYTITITLHFDWLTTEEQPMLTSQRVQENINNAVVKFLGKVGLASLMYQIVNVEPYDQKATLVFERVKAQLFCQFWTAVAFQSKAKITLAEMGVELCKNQQ